VTLPRSRPWISWGSSPRGPWARFEGWPVVGWPGAGQANVRTPLAGRGASLFRSRVEPGRLPPHGENAERELRALIADLQLNERVKLAGFVSEPEKLALLRGAWLHALTSPKEGWGISNLEAAACGTATVASDSPGLRDSVRDGETGFLVPHGNITRLSERIGQILDDVQLRERLGQGARRFAEQFTWERAADGVENFIATVVGSPKR